LDQKQTDTLKDPLLVNLFYEQSFQLVDYLIGRYGMFKIKQVLEEYGKGKGSEEVIRDIYQTSIERIEREWKESNKI